MPRFAPSLAALAALLSLAQSHAIARAAEPDPHEDPPHTHDEAAELEGVVVESTRTNRRISEELIRVEIVEREEIEEKLLMTPGNVAMLVAETPGIRVQATSPALGASNARIRGLRGRYAQLLADGLPLYGGQSSSIGLLQIPPTDLGRVEIIKGSASALYGPASLGGVINLLSRRPADAREQEVLLNTTSRGGHDATYYTSAPATEDWGWSVVGGWHEQEHHDLDDDGWIDTPSYERWTVRPRAFFSGDNGATALVTFGATTEDRAGGTLDGATVADGAAARLGFVHASAGREWGRGMAPVSEDERLLEQLLLDEDFEKLSR